MAFKIKRDVKVYRAKKIILITNILAKNETTLDYINHSLLLVKALRDRDALEVKAIVTEVTNACVVVKFYCCKTISSYS